jgi:hypothetical protein
MVKLTAFAGRQIRVCRMDRLGRDQPHRLRGDGDRGPLRRANAGPGDELQQQVVRDIDLMHGGRRLQVGELGAEWCWT